MFFKQLTKRERILSYLAVLVLSSFFAYTYVIEPVREYLQNLNQQIMIKELRAKKNLKILAKKERVLKEYEKVAERWKGKGSLEEEMTDTLKEIESQARETGLNIIDIKPQLPEVLPPGHYRELFIIVESECKIG
ncbi:MAG: type II secretion system protein GspM [bacterium]